MATKPSLMVRYVFLEHFQDFFFENFDIFEIFASENVSMLKKSCQFCDLTLFLCPFEGMVSGKIGHLH